MIKRILIGLSVFLLLSSILAGFVYYNYRQAQQGLADYQPGQVSISLDSHPDTISLSQPANIDWSISAPADLTTPFTTIYYAAESSPSALTAKDSPRAVGYANHLTDYTQGEFVLPDSFSARLLPVVDYLPVTLYFRAYTRINGSHYWTDEYQLTVTP